MTVNRIIPVIGTKGLYKVYDPYTQLLIESNVYECIAIRYFKDLENNGTDIYDMYYEALGLTLEDFELDRSNNQAIVTLANSQNPPVHIPSSYIKALPDVSIKPYSRVFLSASMGPLPDDVILEPTIQALKNVLSDTIGIEVSVNVGKMSLVDGVSKEDHETMEAVRLGAIKNQESDYSRLARSEELNQSLQQKIVLLEQIIKDNGLLD